MAVKCQVAMFWVVMPCSDVVRCRRFGGPCCICLHGDYISLSGFLKHSFVMIFLEAGQ
jgi:hypothetical protein